MTKLYLGVDGGQTTTAAVIADSTGRLLSAGVGGPANHIHEPGGPERVKGSLRDAIETAARACGLADPTFEVAYLGMTGGTELMAQICREVVPAHKVQLGHDSLIALHSVTFGKPGVVVIAGTGSVAWGRNARGETSAAGGWGYLLGDEGSGYWIAIEGLRAACKAEDGRSDPNTLRDGILKRLGANSMSEVHQRVYSMQLGRPEIAALAVAVGDAAALGDRAAREILRLAGIELGHAAGVVVRRLFPPKAPVEVGTVGGVFRAGAQIMTPFRRSLHRLAPAAVIRSPQVPSAVAAVLLALAEDGIATSDDIVRNAVSSTAALELIKR